MRAACFLVAAMVAAGVVGLVVSQRSDHVEANFSPYSAIVWLPHGDTQAQAQSVRTQCGAAHGAASVSALSRSTSAQTKGQLVFSIAMRWGPDDKRSNSLLNCLNDNPGIDRYGIPL
jgi:hypothetical protein